MANRDQAQGHMANIAHASATAGVALYYTWMLSLIHVLDVSINPSLGISWNRLFILLGIVLVMLFSVFISRKTIGASRLLSIGFLPFAMLGTFMAGFTTAFGPAGVTLLAACELLIGIEFGWFTLSFGELYGLVDTADALKSYLLATVIVIVPVYLISLLPSLWILTVDALLPALAAVALNVTISIDEGESRIIERKAKQRKSPLTSPTFRLPWKTSDLYGLLTPVSVTAGLFTFIFTLGNVYYGSQLLVIIGLCLASTLIFVGFTFFKHAFSVRNMYRLGEVVMVGGLALMPVSTSAGTIFTCMSMCMICTLLVLTLSEVAVRFNISPIRLTSFTNAAAFGGAWLGTLAGSILIFGRASYGTLGLSATTALIIIVVVAYNAFGTDNGGFIFEIHDNPESIELRGVVYDNDDSREMIIKKLAYFETLNRRCAELAAEYRLSAREEEVFTLLEQDYSISKVAERLCISQGTVKTHVHHIYDKLDIHTRDELMALLDPFEKRTVSP